MKKIILAFIFLLNLSIISVAQCEEPNFENTGRTITTKNFEIDKNTAQTDNILSLEATVQNSSWDKIGAESGVFTIFIDGKYNQDLMLFAGLEKFKYQINIGKFVVGKHQLIAVLNKERSAKNIGEVKISSLQINPIIYNSAEDKTAIENAPIIYARPDTVDKFSDIPLLTYYEILANGENSYKIRYTTIFTNEDGGTQTTALMARWGRATDIEWVHEIEVKNGEIQSEIYQGANHVTTKFSGKRELGNHPVIFDVTVNNNFSDKGCSKLRTLFLPIRADLSKKSREVVMDENPWTYRIMAQEMMREGRVNPQKLDANTIDDLRNYFYVEVYSENKQTAIAIEAKTADGKISRSDFENPRLRIDRSGFVRIAVRNPSVNSPIQSLRLLCESVPNQSNGSCQNAYIVKFINLDKDFKIVEKLNKNSQTKTLNPNESISWLIN